MSNLNDTNAQTIQDFHHHAKEQWDMLRKVVFSSDDNNLIYTF